jgi:Uma2 family endonuclease
MNAPVRIPVVLTDDQYEDMARKGAFARVGRVELRGGVVVAMSPAHINHATVMMALLRAADRAILTSAGALEIAPEFTIRFGGGFQPTADIVIWEAALVPADHDGPLPAAAAKLVIEVADRSLDDDLGQKLRDYAQAGLTEYWVADVKGRVINRCTGPGADGYAKRDVFRFGEDVTAATLPLTVETKSL